MEEKKKPAIKPIKNAPEITSVEILPGRVVRLTWCDAVGAERYLIQRFRTVEGEKVKENLESVGAELNSYSDTTINEDGLFEYRVIARKKLSAKEWFNRGSAIVAADIISVDPPKLSRIENMGGKIRISWQKEEGVGSYVVLRRFSFMKKATPIKTLENGETEFLDGSFAEGQLMYYSIQSIVPNGDSISYSRPSNELCSVILPVPVVTKKKKRLGRKATISVRLCAGADGYILFRRTAEDGEREIVSKSEGIDAFTLTDSGKKPAHELWYSVACYKKSAEGQEFIGEESEKVKMFI